MFDAEKAARGMRCLDCGEEYPPYVLQWDHVRGKKEFTLSVDQAQRRAQAAVRAELAKCDLVCSNCHLMRTHEATHFGEAGGWELGRG